MVFILLSFYGGSKVTTDRHSYVHESYQLEWQPDNRVQQVESRTSATASVGI